MSGDLFVGVDCGTASVRAALLDASGRLLATHSELISVWNPRLDHYQQSSAEIWTQTCACVRAVVADYDVERVKGIAFDATCSLVCLDSWDGPVSVDIAGSKEQDVILWMDHRATAEAREITEGRYAVLEGVGNEMSPEMESPKMLWLKRNLPGRFRTIQSFWDLSDFLVHRATGTFGRSACPLVCKWTFDGGWDDGYWKAIGLGEFVAEGYSRIGKAEDVKPVGAPVAAGLSAHAARELGLRAGTACSTGLIDAHAAYVGTVGCRAGGAFGDAGAEKARRLVIIAGTSTCHLINTDRRVLVPGIWGPQGGSTVHGEWTLEGGQSSTGSLLDHLVRNHEAYAEAKELADRSGQIVFDLLNQRVIALAAEQSFAFPNLLVKHLHMLPDHHGNRSPRPSPHPAGVVVGISLARDLDSLAILYYAGLHALVYGTLEIVKRLADHGVAVDEVVMSGGMARNDLFVRLHAEILGVPILVPADAEHGSVRGAAIAGALAAGRLDAMQLMGGSGAQVACDPMPELRDFHSKKFKVFMDLVETTARARSVME